MTRVQGENPPKNPGRGTISFSVPSNGTYVQFGKSAVVGSTYMLDLAFRFYISLFIAMLALRMQKAIG